MQERPTDFSKNPALPTESADEMSKNLGTPNKPNQEGSIGRGNLAFLAALWQPEVQSQTPIPTSKDNE